MATVLVKFNHSAKETLRYVFEHATDGDPVDSLGCGKTQQAVERDFEATRNAYSSHRGNEVVHVMQSWSPEESKKLTPAEVNAMGVELASRSFPGHQFVVATHTDRPHLHNHIVVNSVSEETGKRIHNKIRHWKNLTLVNDDIARGRGLGVPDGERRERALRMSHKVRGMLKYGRFSYIFDTVQKADLAKSFATSYSEYAGILSELGVGVRIEEKNIIYFYGGRSVGVRGRQLGRPYDKAGLEARFKSNDERFAAVPGLRLRVRGAIDTVKSSPGLLDKAGQALTRESGGVAAVTPKKDYASYPKVPRREMRTLKIDDHELAQSIIPVEEVKKARQASIVDYCRRHGIATVKNDKGEMTLKGRDYVVVRENEWINRKNRTGGSLIDFVAIHRNMTFLQAVAHINQNPRLLLLEELFGEMKRKYTPFYFPKGELASRKGAIAKVAEFLEAMRLPLHHAEPLVKSQQVQVSKTGVIRLFGKESGEGTVEFSEEERGRWVRKAKGEARSALASRRGSGRTGTIYTDPLIFLAREDAVSGRKPKARQGPVLALLAPTPHAVGRFLAENPHVERLELVTPNPKAPSPAELDLFGTLKERYRRLGIEIAFVGPEHAGRERGPDLSR